MKLEGKVAIVTGGGSGIGAATAQLFAVERAKVVVADVSQEGAEGVAEEVRRKGGEALAWPVDVTLPGLGRCRLHYRPGGPY